MFNLRSVAILITIFILMIFIIDKSKRVILDIINAHCGIIPIAETLQETIERDIIGCSRIINSSNASKDRLHSAYFYRGIANYIKKKYRLATEDYTNAIKLAPKAPKYLVARGQVYNKVRRYPLAIKDFSRAIKLNPNAPFVYLKRGIAYFHQGNYDSAIRDFTNTINLNPTLPDSYYYRGKAYYGKGDKRSAVIDLNASIKLIFQDSFCYEKLLKRIVKFQERTGITLKLIASRCIQ